MNRIGENDEKDCMERLSTCFRFMRKKEEVEGRINVISNKFYFKEVKKEG